MQQCCSQFEACRAKNPQNEHHECESSPRACLKPPRPLLFPFPPFPTLSRRLRARLRAPRRRKAMRSCQLSEKIRTYHCSSRREAPDQQFRRSAGAAPENRRSVSHPYCISTLCPSRTARECSRSVPITRLAYRAHRNKLSGGQPPIQSTCNGDRTRPSRSLAP